MMLDRRQYLKTVPNLLLKDKKISAILEKNRLSAQAKIILNNNLPKLLFSQCASIQYREQKLTIFVSNSSALSKIRFSIPSLLETFKNSEGFHDIKQIKLKIMVKARGKDTLKKSEEKKKLSKENKALILENAYQMDFEPLKNALIRLASHHSD